MALARLHRRVWCRRDDANLYCRRLLGTRNGTIIVSVQWQFDAVFSVDDSISVDLPTISTIDLFWVLFELGKDLTFGTISIGMEYGCGILTTDVDESNWLDVLDWTVAIGM